MKKLLLFLLLATTAKAAWIGGFGGGPTNGITQSSADGRYVLQTGGVTTTVNGSGITNQSQTPAFDGAMYASDFGMKGDGKLLTNVVSTAGSAVVTSSTANFTAGDVGKCVILYTNYTINPDPNGSNHGTNAMAQLYTTIASFQSSSQVTLSSIAAFSTGAATNRMWYGTDNTTAFQNMINAAYTNNGNMQIGRGIFMFNGPLQDTNVRNAVITLPNDNTSPPKMVEIDGQGAAVANVSEFYAFPIATNGTILLIATSGVGGAGSNACFIGGSHSRLGGAGLNATHSIILRRLTILSMPNPQMDVLGLMQFGGYLLDTCAIGVDFVSTQQEPGGASATLIPATTNTAAIRGPYPPTIDFTKIYNTWIWGYGYGVFCGDHMQVYGSSILHCGFDFWMWPSGDIHSFGIHLMDSAEAVSGDGNAQMVEMYGIVFEGNMYDIGNVRGEMHKENLGFVKGPDFQNNRLTVSGPFANVDYQNAAVFPAGFVYQNRGPVYTTAGSNDAFATPVGTFMASNSAASISTLFTVATAEQTGSFSAWGRSTFDGSLPTFAIGDWLGGEGYYAANGANLATTEWQLYNTVNNNSPFVALATAPNLAILINTNGVTSTTNMLASEMVATNGLFGTGAATGPGVYFISNNTAAAGSLFMDPVGGLMYIRSNSVWFKVQIATASGR